MNLKEDPDVQLAQKAAAILIIVVVCAFIVAGTAKLITVIL